MWKKLFVILLSLNLLAFVSVALWFELLPTPKQVSRTPSPLPANAANIELVVGQEAVNTYLSYALTEQKDVQKILSYASVTFQNQWNIRFGLKVADKVVPCDIELTPVIHQGNLWFPIDGATLGGFAVPKSLLFMLFEHVTWPSWIVIDPFAEEIRVNLTSRPSGQYRIRAMGYSNETRRITFEVSMMPAPLSTKLTSKP